VKSFKFWGLAKNFLRDVELPGQALRIPAEQEERMKMKFETAKGCGLRDNEPLDRCRREYGLILKNDIAQYGDETLFDDCLQIVSGPIRPTRPSALRPRTIRRKVTHCRLPAMRKVVGSGVRREFNNISHSSSGTIP
jgi:hypothetical protein